MSKEDEQGGTVIELLLREPQIVAWLEPPAPERDRPDDDDEPPRAA